MGRAVHFKGGLKQPADSSNIGLERLQEAVDKVCRMLNEYLNKSKG